VPRTSWTEGETHDCQQSQNSSGTPASLPECYLSQTDFFSCVLLLPTVALTFGKCRSSANGTCTLTISYSSYPASPQRSSKAKLSGKTSRGLNFNSPAPPRSRIQKTMHLTSSQCQTVFSNADRRGLVSFANFLQWPIICSISTSSQFHHQPVISSSVALSANGVPSTASSGTKSILG
jgi:hypothetical protein